MKRFLYYILPGSIRLIANRIHVLTVYVYEFVTKKRPYGVPPRGKIFIDYGDYEKQGEKFLNYFKELAGLKPDNAVLDVGCGIGRMAVPLTRFLDKKGSYDGFDNVKSSIDWCKKHISNQYPNFRFQYTGPYNPTYNTSDKADADNIIFPYGNSKFDFVFLTQLFTQMMPDELEIYLRAICRVMKPGASCIMSFYIVNCVSEDLMIKKPTPMNFPVNKGLYRLQSAQDDKSYVAYDEEWLLEKLGNAGLKMDNIEYGQWCGRDHFFDYHDLLICSKV